MRLCEETETPGTTLIKLPRAVRHTPHREETTDSGECMCVPLFLSVAPSFAHVLVRQKVYIGNTRSTRFSGSVQSPDERRVGLRARHGVVKSSSSSSNSDASVDGDMLRSRFTYLRAELSPSVAPIPFT